MSEYKTNKATDFYIAEDGKHIIVQESYEHYMFRVENKGLRHSVEQSYRAYAVCIPEPVEGFRVKGGELIATKFVDGKQLLAWLDMQAELEKSMRNFDDYFSNEKWADIRKLQGVADRFLTFSYKLKEVLYLMDGSPGGRYRHGLRRVYWMRDELMESLEKFKKNKFETSDEQTIMELCISYNSEICCGTYVGFDSDFQPTGKFGWSFPGPNNEGFWQSDNI